MFRWNFEFQFVPVASSPLIRQQWEGSVFTPSHQVFINTDNTPTSHTPDFSCLNAKQSQLSPCWDVTIVQTQFLGSADSHSWTQKTHKLTSSRRTFPYLNLSPKTEGHIYNMMETEKFKKLNITVVEIYMLLTTVENQRNKPQFNLNK